MMPHSLSLSLPHLLYCGDYYHGEVDVPDMDTLAWSTAKFHLGKLVTSRSLMGSLGNPLFARSIQSCYSCWKPCFCSHHSILLQLLRKMKGIDLFCASPASTAICVSMDHKSMVCSGSRAIDRHNPHLLDRRRIKPPSPCPQSSSNPRSYHQKNTKSSAKQIELASPPGSSRYLLSDTPFLDASSMEFDPVQASSLVPVEPESSRRTEEDYFDPVPALIRMETTKSRSIKEDKLSIFKSSSTRSQEQVVVLKVSLHCKGCEHKVRKHISRMQGVKSFNIDFPAKKVTVIGNVTPLGVLTSISKVKKAQFWPSSAPLSSSSSSVS